MEKRVTLSLVLMLIVLVNFFIISVYSQEEKKDANLPADIGKGIENITEGIEGVKGLKEKTETALEQDIIVPENLQIFARVLFGIKDSVKFDVFIVLICVWIGILILIQKILQLTPFFDGWKSWLASFVILCLISITGIFTDVVNLWFSFADIFGILEKWPVLKVVVVVSLTLMIAIAISILLDRINKRTRVEVAEEAGMRAGFGARLLSMIADVFTGKKK